MFSFSSIFPIGTSGLVHFFAPLDTMKAANSFMGSVGNANPARARLFLNHKNAIDPQFIER